MLVGAKESEPQEQIEALLRDAERPATEDEEGQTMKKEKIEKPMPRVTEADRTGDVKSLNRALTRTLYLVVKSVEGGTWRFPSSTLIGGEDLHRVRSYTAFTPIPTYPYLPTNHSFSRPRSALSSKRAA